MLLEIDNVHVHYHKVAALKGIDMAVPEDGIVTIIGANGAGKSTTLRSISGLVRISDGEIRFAGKRIDGLPPEKIVALGIAHVPEGRRVFPNLTVEENLRTGAFLRSDKAGIDKDLEEVFLHFPRLKERRKQWARSLSGGEQQMLAIGGRSCRGRRCWFSTNPPWACRRSWCRRSLASFATSSPVAFPWCWSSRMPSSRLGSRDLPMCSRPAGSRCRVRRTSCMTTSM